MENTVKEYKFDLFTATMICEGAEDPESEEQYYAAWQFLVDTGACWSLQGFFGREATRLIEEGKIKRKE